MQRMFSQGLRNPLLTRRSARASRAMTAPACIQQLERRKLLSTAVTAFPVPKSGSISVLTLAPDGDLWYQRHVTYGGMILKTLPGRIGRVAPSGAVTEYALPAGGDPRNGFTVGPDGNLWFTEVVFDANDSATAAFLCRVTPSGVISEFPLSQAFVSMSGLTVGPDGNLWFSEHRHGESGDSGTTFIARATTAGTVTEFPVPGGGDPTGLTLGSDGNLWFSTPSQIGRVTTSGAITEYALPSGGTVPGLTPGSDGNLWFVETVQDSYKTTAVNIGRITPPGQVTEFPLSAPGVVSGLTLAPDGALWFSESFFWPMSSSASDVVIRVTPSGVVSEFPLAPGGRTDNGLTLGSDGNLWFTETITNDSGTDSSSFIDRISPSGTILRTPLSTDEYPVGPLLLGPDGDLWFIGNISTTDLRTPGTFVGRVAPSGAIATMATNAAAGENATSIALIENSVPTVGPDGNIWFTQAGYPPSSVTVVLPQIGLAIQRINVAAFPAPQPFSPTITDLVRSGVHAQPTELILTVSAPLDATAAVDLHNYVVVISDAWGRLHSRPLRFRHAAYNAATNTVTLTMRRPLPLRGYYRVTVHGNLTGINGSETNYSALLHKFGTVTPATVHAGRARTRHAPPHSRH